MAFVLDRFTRMPPTGAVAARVTVPVAGLPDFAGLGLMERPEMFPKPALGGFRVSVVATALEDVAVMTAVC